MKRFFFIVFAVFMFGTTMPQSRLPYVINAQGGTCDTIYTQCDKPAEFPGGKAAMQQFFFENLKNADVLNAYVTPNRVLVKVLVDKEGAVAGCKTVIAFSKQREEDVLSVISKFPKFAPAEVQGRQVCSYFIITLYYNK